MANILGHHHDVDTFGRRHTAHPQQGGRIPVVIAAVETTAFEQWLGQAIRNLAAAVDRADADAYADAFLRSLPPPRRPAGEAQPVAAIRAVDRRRWGRS
jgi:hypothetical protein